MAEQSEAAKRNAGHINRIAQFADQIFALKSMVVEDTDWKATKSTIGSIARELRSLYNNRETALVCTKLDEAQIWCDEQDIEQIRAKLVEARGWCVNYIEVLKTD